MVAVNVFSNLPAMQREFSKLEKKTLNLIQRNAMLDAAFRTQKVLRLTSYPKAFPDAVNKGHVKAVTTLGASRGRKQLSRAKLKERIQRALSRGRRADIAIFDATNQGRGSDYMLRHAKGGRKIPIDGSNIAVPTRHLTAMARGVRGIRKSMRPQQVLAQRKRGGKQGFVTKINGHTMIARRETKNRLPIIPLYSLVPSADIPGRFKFYEDARVYRKLFAAAYSKEWQFRVGSKISRKYLSKF